MNADVIATAPKRGDVRRMSNDDLADLKQKAPVIAARAQSAAAAWQRVVAFVRAEQRARQRSKA